MKHAVLAIAFAIMLVMFETRVHAQTEECPPVDDILDIFASPGFKNNFDSSPCKDDDSGGTCDIQCMCNIGKGVIGSGLMTIKQAEYVFGAGSTCMSQFLDISPGGVVSGMSEATGVSANNRGSS